MLAFGRNLKLKYKLGVLVATAFLGTLIIGTVALSNLRSSLLQEKELKPRHVVETAYGVLEHFYHQVKDRKLSGEEAQGAAIAAIKALRYEGNEYFWINDMQPVMVMHPYKPELNGKDLSYFKDPTGKRIFVEFAEVVRRQSAGYVNYLWPKPGKAEPVA
jgi:methyl-accepting chemotaxis protein